MLVVVFTVNFLLSIKHAADSQNNFLVILDTFLSDTKYHYGVITELYYSLEERVGMKKCRQKHGGFWALLTPLGTYGYRYLPLTNRDAMLLTKSFTPLVFAKKFMAFLFSGQSLREKSFLFRLWT